MEPPPICISNNVDLWLLITSYHSYVFLIITINYQYYILSTHLFQKHSYIKLTETISQKLRPSLDNLTNLT